MLLFVIATLEMSLPNVRAVKKKKTIYYRRALNTVGIMFRSYYLYLKRRTSSVTVQNNGYTLSMFIQPFISDERVSI